MSACTDLISHGDVDPKRIDEKWGRQKHSSLITVVGPLVS